MLKNKIIPLILMSANGLGGDAIYIFFKKHKKLYKNIHIISNSYEWDKEGYAISYKKLIIHCMNKDETVIRNYHEIFSKIKHRKNVILLGDSIDDVDMVKGFDYDNLIKIGFMNFSNDDVNKYKKNYDVIITNDGAMNYVNGLLKKIMS